MTEVTAVEMVWPPPSLLSVSVDLQADGGEVTEAADGGEVSEVTEVK